MRVLLGLTILLVISFSFDATAKRKPKDPCDCIETETDAFGKTTRKNRVSFDWNKYAFNLAEVNGKRSLTIQSSFQGVVDLTIPAESPVLFAMTDGSIIEIKSIAPALPNKVVSSYGIFTSWEQEFSSDDEVLKKLMSSRIKAVQVIVNNKEVSVELSEGEGEDILNTIQCMLKAPAAAPTKG